MPGDRTLRVVVVIVAIIAFVALLCVGVWLVKGRYDTAVITSYVTKGNVKVEGDMALANTTEAVEARADDATITEQRQELKDAETPPPVPDGMSDRQRRGCIILRQQGQDLSRFPACQSLAPRR